MLLKAKLWLDFHTGRISRLLRFRKWLYTYLAAKWVVIIVFTTLVVLWANENDSWLILITPMVALPGIIRRDVIKVRATDESANC